MSMHADKSVSELLPHPVMLLPSGLVKRSATNEAAFVSLGRYGSTVWASARPFRKYTTILNTIKYLAARGG